MKMSDFKTGTHHDARVWGQADVPSWYRNAAGRVTQNWPGTLEEFWAITRVADPADYRLD